MRAVLILVLLMCALPVAAQAATRQPHCCTSRAVATAPPAALLAFANFADSSCQVCGKIPGPLAMQTLFWGGQTGGSNVASNAGFTADCPGRTATTNWADTSGSHCQFFAYDGYFRTTCKQNGNSNDPGYYNWQWSIAHGFDENAALHYNSAHGNLSGLRTSTNRFVGGGESGSCNADASDCQRSAGVCVTSGNDLLFNPAEPTSNACLYTYLTGIGIPCSFWATGPWLSVAAGEGVAEDYMWLNTTGAYWSSTEYGNTVDYALPQNAGTGAGFTLLNGFAQFYNSQCGTICVPMAAKTPTGGVNFCQTNTKPAGVTLTGTHCYPQASGLSWNFSMNMIDNRMRFEEFCSALSHSNFQAFLMENPIDRISATGNNAVQILNTVYYNQTNSVCSGVKYVMEEASPTYVQEGFGVEWLAPSSDGTPDNVIIWPTVANNGNTQIDVPYWPMYEIVPFGYEGSTAPFSYGGTAPDLGSGCQNASNEHAPQWNSGDTGGVPTVYCPAKNLPIMVGQYAHSYLLGGSDLGPVAVVVNTSNTAESIQSSWFANDPASTYKHVIVFKICGGVLCEGAHIPASYSGALLAALQAVNTNCTNATYCLSDPTTGIDMTSTAFSAASVQSNCADGNTCVAAHSATFLTSQ